MKCSRCSSSCWPRCSTGGIASRLRDQLKISSDRTTANQALFDFSRKLSGTVKADDVLWVVVNQLQASTQRNICLARVRGRRTAPCRRVAAGQRSRCCRNDRRPLGLRAKRTGRPRHRHAAQQQFPVPPMKTPNGVVGVCGIQETGTPLETDDAARWSM